LAEEWHVTTPKDNLIFESLPDAIEWVAHQPTQVVVISRVTKSMHSILGHTNSPEWPQKTDPQASWAEAVFTHRKMKRRPAATS